MDEQTLYEAEDYLDILYEAKNSLQQRLLLLNKNKVSVDKNDTFEDRKIEIQTSLNMLDDLIHEYIVFLISIGG